MINKGLGEPKELEKTLRELDVIIVAAGFEDRAFHVLASCPSSMAAHLILVVYENDIPGNDAIAQKFMSTANQKFDPGRVNILPLRQSRIREFIDEFAQIFRSLAPNYDKVGVDISGMPSYLIFAVLNHVRENRPYQNQKVLYTAAKDYTPTKEEYEGLKDKQGDDIEYIPKSMALEMAENLVFEPFSGYRSAGTKSCLALFAGYEAHRSTGVVDAINPTLLLLMYGQPADEKLNWRLDLSRRLHHKFEKTRRCAIEEVPTWDIDACVAKLEEYYDVLIDDYDLTVSAICSKMQTVASFLFGSAILRCKLRFRFQSDMIQRGALKASMRPTR